MGLMDFLFGKKEKIQQLPTMSSEQSQLLNQLLGNIGGPLQAGIGNLGQLLGGGEGAYQAFEAPAMRQFYEQIVPGIAEQFSGMGAGAQRSSAFGQQLGAAGAGLADTLAMQRAGLQQEGLSQLQSLLGMGLGAKPFENILRPGTSGAIGPLVQALGMGTGFALGGSLGTSLGGMGSNLFSSLFGPKKKELPMTTLV